MTAYQNPPANKSLATKVPEFVFKSENYEDIFTLVEFKGEEEMSSLFSFDMLIKVDKQDDSDDGFIDILDSSATFSLSYNGDKKTFNGIVISLQQDVRRSIKNSEYSFYRIQFVPGIWEENQTVKSRIFSDSSNSSMTVLDILNEEIQTIQSSNLAVSIHNACSFSSFANLPFTCQYQESDWGFMSRLMERYGIYYYFDMSDDANYEMILANDNEYPKLNEILTQLGDANKINISETRPSGKTWYREISRISSQQQRIPSFVRVKQEDPEHPSTPFDGIYPSSADHTDRGGIQLSNEHPVSQEDAELLAQIQYEHFQTQQKTWQGKSGICMMSPGYQFELDDSAQSVLITRVKHIGENLDAGASDGHQEYYKNQFECIPAETIYRPKRKANIPVINNLETGEIFSSQDDPTKSELDTEGRYKVKFHFISEDDSDDLSKMAHHVRMAQPAAGLKDQVFFPLRPGVEVMIAFLGGCPDRPVITGALSNGSFPSKVTSNNPEDAIIETEGLLATIAHAGRFDSSTTTNFDENTISNFNTLNAIHDYTKDSNGFIQPSQRVTLTLQEESDGKRIINRQFGDEITLSFGDTLITQYGNQYDFGGYSKYNLGERYQENFTDTDGPLNTKVTLPSSIASDITHPDILDAAGPDWTSIEWPEVSKKDINIKAEHTNPTLGSEWGELANAADVATASGVNFQVNPQGGFGNGGVKVTKSYEDSYDYKLGQAVTIEDRINKLDIKYLSSSTTQIEMGFHNGALRSWKKVKNRETREKSWSSDGKLTALSESVPDGDNWKTRTESYSLGGEEKIAENTVISTPDGKHTDDKTYDARTGDLMSHNIAFNSGGAKSEMNFVFAALAKSDFNFGVSTTFSLSASASVAITTSLSAKLAIDLGASGDISLKTNASLIFEGKFSPAGIVKLFNDGLEYHGPGSKLDKAAAIKAELETMAFKDATCMISMKKLELTKGGLMLEDKPVRVSQGFQFLV